MQQVSKMNAVSVGHVAANKPLNSANVEVIPIEAMPIQSGELADNASEYTAKATDKDGAAYEASAVMKSTVVAEWIPIGDSNRMTPPDVRRGELVMLYQFADSDKYYWNTLKNDLSFRKLETVVYAFSATPDEKAKPNHNNCYFIEVSTHKGRIHIHTTQANGEPYGYDILLNTKEGNFSITDTIGNQFLIDSSESRILLKNDKGSFIDLDKLILTMQTGDQINLNTKVYTLKSEQSTVQTTTSTLTASTHSVTAETSVSGTLSQGGGNGAKFAGTMDVVGRITGEAEIHARLVTADEIHGGHVTSDSSITAPNV